MTVNDGIEEKSHEKSQHITGVRALPAVNGWIVETTYNALPPELSVHGTVNQALGYMEQTMTEISENRGGD